MGDKLIISEVFRFPQKKFQWQMKFFRPCIYLFDWHKKKILRKMVVAPAYFDNEEYNFLRLCYHYNGARGITSNNRFIFIALQNTIFVYDIELKNCVGRIDNELFNGIHEILWHKDRLFVTCAVTDSVLILTEVGEVIRKFHLGTNKFLLNQFNLNPRELDNRLDYRLMHKTKRMYHINNIQVLGEDIYVNLNRLGSFVKIFPEEEIIIKDDSLVQSHNAQFTPDGKYILINDTGNYALKVYDSQGARMSIIDLRNFSLPINFNKLKIFGQSHEIKAGWLRGLAFSNEEESVVYLGLSPAMVVAVDYISGDFIDYFRFRKNIWISIHGLHNLSRSTDSESA
jgi:hypothetical protein